MKKKGLSVREKGMISLTTSLSILILVAFQDDLATVKFFVTILFFWLLFTLYFSRRGVLITFNRVFSQLSGITTLMLIGAHFDLQGIHVILAVLLIIGGTSRVVYTEVKERFVRRKPIEVKE